MLKDTEIEQLRKSKIDEINTKYKEKISSLKEIHSKLISEKKQKITDYIKNAKSSFSYSINSLRNRIRLEDEFINLKTLEINCNNIMYVIKLWVFSIIGEINKNSEIAKKRLKKERNSIDTLHQIYLVEQNYPNLMIEHINDIIQRIQFLLSLVKCSRPNSSIKGNSKKNKIDSISKANIHFEEGIKIDFVSKEITDQSILSKLAECSCIMSVEYFSQNSKNISENSNERFFKLNKYTVQYDNSSNEQNYSSEPNENNEDNCAVDVQEGNEQKSSVKLSKGVIGYNILKSIIMHAYRIITNRLVRTAHLADISNSKNKETNGVPPGYVSQLITKSIDDTDVNHKHGIKSVHIDKKTLAKEIDRLSVLIKDRKDILIGTKNIFPEIEILEVYENSKETSEQTEYEEDFETDSKNASNQNTVRSKKQQNNSILVEKYIMFLSPNASLQAYDDYDQDSISDKSKLGSITDNLCEWPTCMKIKQIDKKEMIESDSVSNCSNKEVKSVKNSRLSKNSSAKKTPIIAKKVISRIINYPELEIDESPLYDCILKDITFTKEKKKPAIKQEKSLSHSLCKFHSDVNAYMKTSKSKNVELILNRKHCGYTLIYECLDDINDSLTSASNSRFNSYKQLLKGSIMHSILCNTLEENIKKIVDKGIERLRPK